MSSEQRIVQQVLAAKSNTQAADDLISDYMPFIKSETAKFLGRIPVEGHDDELSIAMFAFYEAAMAYDSARGAFLKLASVAIRRRLIDYSRKEKRHSQVISLYDTADGEEDGDTLLEKLDSGRDDIAELESRRAARDEIEEFSRQLADFGITLSEVADNCPKQERTLTACLNALAYARENPLLLDQLISSRKLPIGPLASGSGVERKTLERHRKYLVAIMLAYTNGYEIIRGHLYRISPRN